MHQTPDDDGTTDSNQDGKSSISWDAHSNSSWGHPSRSVEMLTQPRSKRSVASTLDSEAKRPRTATDEVVLVDGNQIPAWTRFLTPEHRTIIMRYLQGVTRVIQDRERVPFNLDRVPGALEHILDATAYLVGDLWEQAVELSKLRIDVGVHEILEDRVAEDLSPLVRNDKFKALDEQEASAFAAALEKQLGINQGNQDSNPNPTGKSRGRGRAPQDDGVSHSPPPDQGDLGGGSNTNKGSTQGGHTTKSHLFGQSAEESATSARDEMEAILLTQRKAKEASLVRRKQSTLSREVTIEDIIGALNLNNAETGKPLIPLPERVRKSFQVCCHQYYEAFTTRMLNAGNARPPGNTRAQQVPPHHQVLPNRQQGISPNVPQAMAGTSNQQAMMLNQAQIQGNMIIGTPPQINMAHMMNQNPSNPPSDQSAPMSNQGNSQSSMRQLPHMFPNARPKMPMR